MSTGTEVNKFDDRVEYSLNGLRHRIDGPAVEWANGDKYWYYNGLLHRIDGPAIEWSKESEIWRIGRDDKEWWIEGENYYIEADYWKEMHKRGLISEEKLFRVLL